MHTTAPLAGRRFLPSSKVMAVLGYANRAAFHQFVRAAGVPHTRLNRRRIVFDEAALTDWLADRSTGGKS
jgi:hypothetical protein